MHNLEIRESIKQNGVKYWQLADALGISAPTLTIWLRHELPPEKKQRIMEAIEEVARNAEESI